MTVINKKTGEDVKVGDKLVRMIGGTLPMPMRVTEITEETIICGAWQFCKVTGAEIDEDLGWGKDRTGSYLIFPD